MANSGWRIGSFYFKTQEEPYRVDVRRVRRTQVPTELRFLPWNMLWATGFQPTNIVMQGLLADFLQGTSGDFGLEALDIEMQKEDEVIIELENFNSTDNLRRYYGLLTDFKYTLDGKKPSLYDYLVSMVCPNPFGYRAGAVEYDNTSIASTSAPGTACSLVNDFPGAPTYPYFKYYNDTGSTVTSLVISDDATSAANANGITITGSLANGDSWLIYPIKWDVVSRTYGINAVWEYNGNPSDSDDIMEISADNPLVTRNVAAASIRGGEKWPRITQVNDTFRSYASHANGNLVIQWRDVL